ncbi:alpha/beta-hydrolase [Fistulina hepatica ATCC 64428]|uniref:Alpha/beta-hydrolase n=1 Tax=Fistulina hepatica ATCC 64428 TaxID=1128425 RepID=A0A0D7A2V2_9AGAR|nr:alpha/beta-hydrolase [Fistulina hepatica ATCC 64428]
MPVVQEHVDPELYHPALKTVFRGVVHPLSTPSVSIHQYRGIKYASVHARFRQSTLFTSYPPVTDATNYGPICPQPKDTNDCALFGIDKAAIPKQMFKQNEFQCLNMNITCPGDLQRHSRIPVMLWVHGGGDKGSGSKWVYDGASLVRKSAEMGRPVIVVTINYRLGLFGFAASSALREDNKAAGDDGVGNYGIRDQRRAMEWLHYFVDEFGGDPANIVLFGNGTGASDIVHHLLSSDNETRPLFRRAVIQSPLGIEPTLPDVSMAGARVTRIMAALGLTTVEQLRHVEPEYLARYGDFLRVVDDGVFLRRGWKSSIIPDEPRHTLIQQVKRLDSRSLSRSRVATPTLHLPSHSQPLIVGDCVCDADLWSETVSMWTSAAVVRRLKAICQSLTKANNLLRGYDISALTSEEEILDRVLDLVNDARVAWPTDCFVQAARRERSGHGVWRYVFDQEGPARGVAHHAADIMYLFDTVPLPSVPEAASYDRFCDSFSDSETEEEQEIYASVCDADMWCSATVDSYAYGRVRDTMQAKWIGFAYGENPWRSDHVFVFGPEGETGERSARIFDGRRRRHVWRNVLDPLGMQLVQKLGVELSRGPPITCNKLFRH